MTEPTYLVRLSSGLVIRFTKAELDAMWKGVDREAANLLGSPSGAERPTAPCGGQSCGD